MLWRVSVLAWERAARAWRAAVSSLDLMQQHEAEASIASAIETLKEIDDLRRTATDDQP